MLDFYVFPAFHELTVTIHTYRYKKDCFFHGELRLDYKRGSVECAKRGARMLTIKDRATFQFIR